MSDAIQAQRPPHKGRRLLIVSLVAIVIIALVLFHVISGSGKKKPVTTWSLADLQVSADEVGSSAAATAVRAAAVQPPRQAGTVVVDHGEGAAAVADFLVEQQLL